MIIVPKKNLYLPKRIWGRKKFQRGIICATAVYGAEVAGDVTVSGATIVDIGAGVRMYRATLVVQLDGTTDSISNVTQIQINASTDWIIPNGDANSDYDVRYTGLTGDPLDDSTSLAEDVWGDLAANKWFEQRWDSGAGLGGNSSTITVEIRWKGGSPLDSASYTLTAERLF